MNWYDRRRVDIATRVYQVIPRAPAYPESAAVIAGKAGVTVAQVHTAVEFLRETFSREGADPPHSVVSFIGPWGGYLISEDEADIRAFQRQRMGIAMTIIRRTYQGVIRPFVVKHVQPINPTLADEITTSFETALAKIAALV